jgi:hypothetical protein
MANKIVLKKSSVAAKVPLSTDLEVGEIAVNLVDQKLYSKKADGTVVLVGNSTLGDVTGAASSTDNAVVRFDGTTGKVIQNSSVTIDDSNNVSGVATLNANNIVIADNATLGSSNSDSVAVNGRITTDLEPNTTGTHDIGTSGRNWRDGFFSRNLAAATLNATDVNANSAIISANTSTNALRITQTGTGNALVVEDSANPDATPTVIAADGTVIIGNTTSVPVWGFGNALQVWGGFGYTSQGRFSNDAFAARHTFVKSRSTSPGGFTVVQNNDQIGEVAFVGADSAAYIEAARISAQVDGTPGTNDMPGRLVFLTTRDGASSPTEAVRIDNQQRVGISTGAVNAWARMQFGGILPSGSGFSITNYVVNSIPSTTTTEAATFWSDPSTTAASFTLPNFSHFKANNFTVGAGSTVTNQYGFLANSTLTGATNNYGFFSNIASGTGRWNFYAGGSADNFFQGKILQAAAGDYSPTGLAFNFQSHAVNTVNQGVGVFNWSTSGSAPGGRVSLLRGNATAAGTYTAVTAFAQYGQIDFWGADGTKFVEAARITAYPDGTPGTNDMPGRLVFSTTADGASSPTERMRIGSNGNIGIGISNAAGIAVYLGKTLTGATTSYGVLQSGAVQSDVTVVNYGFFTQLNTQAAAFTLGQQRHFAATQGIIGATSAVTNQFGFFADSTLTGATNNYGFYGNIASGTGRFNFYAAGTAANYFAGKVFFNTFSDISQLNITGGIINGAATTSLSSTIRAAEPLSTYLTNFKSTSIIYSGTASTGTTSGISNADLGQLAFVNTANALIRVNGATPLIFATSDIERMRIDSAGNVQVGTAALATTATNGFLYIPTCAGVPTGTPTTKTGLAPMVIDSTNNKMYIYSGGAWVALN